MVKIYTINKSPRGVKANRDLKTTRGRTLLEKHKDPKDRFSRKFFSEEKYHYSQNLQIEEELQHFKKVAFWLQIWVNFILV